MKHCTKEEEEEEMLSLLELEKRREEKRSKAKRELVEYKELGIEDYEQSFFVVCYAAS